MPRLTMPAALGLVAACLLTSACTVGGAAVGGTSDLAARSVTAADFPVPGATRVPPNAVAYALGDLIGRPVASAYSPQNCQPAAVSAEGAVVYVATVPAQRSTFSTAVAGVDHDLDTVTERARRCPRAMTGDPATATTEIQTQVRPAPTALPGVKTAAILRTEQTGGDAAPLMTRTLTLMGQRGDVRVYAQYRWPSAGDIAPDAAAQLDELFTKVQAKAFGT
ncbi:hypothetical protein [Gordonia sp. NPDC003429]